MKKWAWSLITLLIVFQLSCGKKSEEGQKNKSTEEKTPTQSLKIDPEKVTTLKGKVLLSGNAPPPQQLPIRGNPECKIFHTGPLYDESIMVKDGALQNVFIYIKEGLENYSFPPPQTPVKIDQRKCIYTPHVVGVQVNQPLLLFNSDPTLHNVHSYSKNNPTWNLGMPFEGMELTQKIENPEVMITLKCDVHPWMTGYVGVLPHPYFAVTGDDGQFELTNLPPGEYIIEAWHEKLGTRSQKIQLNSQERKELEFSFDPSL